MEQVEAGPEHDGGPLPALAVNGRIVVSGVEPTVRELELLLADHLDEDGEILPAALAIPAAWNAADATERKDVPVRKRKTPGSLAGKIIGFVILLIILFTAVKILSLTPRSYKRGMGRLPGGPCSGSQASMRCGGKPPGIMACDGTGRSGLRLSSPYARSR